MVGTTSKLFDAAAKNVKSKKGLSATTKNTISKAAVKAKKSYTSPEIGLTSKGAVTNKSSGSKVLDMFSKAGTYRLKDEKDILELIKPALNEEPALFGACLFYMRDVLEGQGERRFFRVSLNYLAKHHKEVVRKLLPYVPFYGRWDDLFALKGTSLYDEALSFYARQLKTDYASLKNDSEAHISLAAKWAPSEKGGKESRILWKDLYPLVGTSPSPKSYRKIVTTLRNRLRIVESKMCAKDWESIDYSKVPSRASLIYRNAFKKHDTDRYKEFIESLKSKPKEEVRKSIKATTLYPYELVNRYLSGHNSPKDDTLDVLWNALPDYLQGRHKNSLAIVDVSGSMNIPVAENVTAMSVAISLGLYLADNAEGIWKDRFITFSSNPQFLHIEGDTLYEKIKFMERSDWSMSTNLDKVFEQILSLAIRNNLKDEDLPETVYIISDMEFDDCINTNLSNFQSIERKYSEAGYTRPNIVFWQVSYSSSTPVTFGQYGTALISGFSATAFKSIMGDATTPEDMMRSVLEAPRYDPIREIFVSI